jgi:hypothetical protein
MVTSTTKPTGKLRGYYSPRPDYRPKPIIERIELTQEQKDEIDGILQGKLKKETVEKLEAKGINAEKWIKHRNPSTRAYRIGIIKEKYFKGLCSICRDFPLYKLTYQLDGISLIEFYCSECFEKRGLKNER